MKRSLATLTCAVLLSISALPAAASAFYVQTAANANGWLSETANGSNGASQSYDNFAFATGGTTNEVLWTGWVLPDYGSLDGFAISFYNDALSGSDHVPGTLISSTTISGTANQVRSDSPNADKVSGFGVFDFSANVSFTGVAGTQYWISIVADPEHSTSWSWANSDGGDSSFFLDHHDGDANLVGTDLAFSLVSTTTPEPSSLVLCASGMLGLAGVARRRYVRR